MHAWTKRKGQFEVSDWRRPRVDPIRRRLEPSRDFCKVKRLELIGIETGKANISPLRTPNSQATWRSYKWTAVGVERQPRLIRFLLRRQRNHIPYRTFIAVMRPNKPLSGDRMKFRKCFPIPWGWPDGACELLPDAGRVCDWHTMKLSHRITESFGIEDKRFNRKIADCCTTQSTCGRYARALYVRADELHDVIHRCAGLKDGGDTKLLECADILIRNDSAHQN